MKRFLLVLLLLPTSIFAANTKYSLTIENHQFTPAQLHIPAGEKVKLVIENKDATPEEFESQSLNREKIIPGHAKSVVWIGPLQQGEYRFVGEFHEDTAQGVVIVE